MNFQKKAQYKLYTSFFLFPQFVTKMKKKKNNKKQETMLRGGLVYSLPHT